MLCEGNPYRPAIVSSILAVTPLPSKPKRSGLQTTVGSVAGWPGRRDGLCPGRAPGFGKFCAWAFGNAFFPRKSSCAETGSSSNAPKHEDRLCCVVFLCTPSIWPGICSFKPCCASTPRRHFHSFWVFSISAECNVREQSFLASQFFLDLSKFGDDFGQICHCPRGQLGQHTWISPKGRDSRPDRPVQTMHGYTLEGKEYPCNCHPRHFLKKC